MTDLEELAETLSASEIRIDRQIRLVAELDWSGRAQDARMARELLAAITECRDLRLMRWRRWDKASATSPPPRDDR